MVKQKEKKQKNKEEPKRNSSMIQEASPTPPSIYRSEALSHACLSATDLADAVGRASAAVLLLGLPKLNAPSIVQAITEAERNAIAAASRLKALRERVSATPDLDNKVG